jgi:hypothetical protein
MKADELIQGFRTLNKLAESEYHQDLQQLLSKGPDSDHGDPSLQIGRLIGVAMKEPFAVPRDLNRPSGHSRAYRTWELVDEPEFNKRASVRSWQLEVLHRLAAEEGEPRAYGLALDAHHERGFFGYLARSTAKYICGDAKIRKEIKKAFAEAKKSGINLSVTSPEILVGSAGLTAGMVLIQFVPILGVVGAPVIAGFVLIIYRIGVDAFCEWTNSHNIDASLEKI